MPISFTCSCGKKLKVADNLAGKKVKCPGCQKATPVPAEDDAAPPPAAKPAKPAAKPAASPIKPAAAVAKPGAKDKPAPPKAAPVAKAKAPIKPPVDDDEPDLDDFLDDEPPAPKAPVKKKPAAPVDDDDDLSSFADDDFPPPAPAKKGKKPVVQEDDDDLNDDDDDDMPAAPRGKKPAPPKKKGGKGMLLVLLLLLLVLAGGGGAYWWFFMQDPPRVPPVVKGPPPGIKTKTPDENKEIKNNETPMKEDKEKKQEDPIEKKKDETKEEKKEDKKEDKKDAGLNEIAHLPVGAAGFVAFRMGEWWAGASGQAIQQLPAVKMATPFFDMAGVSPADIERVQVAVFPPTNAGQNKAHIPAFGVVTTNKPIDLDKLKTLLQKFGKEIKVAGEVCYESADAKPTDPILYFKNDQMMIAADPPIMEKYLKKELKPDTSFEAELEKVANYHIVVAGKIPPGTITPEMLKSVPPTVVPDAKLITGMQGFEVYVSDQQRFEIRARLVFGDEDKAKQVHMMADGFVGLGKLALDKFEKDPELDKKPEKDLLPLAKETLENLKVGVEEKAFTAEISLPLNLSELIPLMSKFVVVPKGKEPGKTPPPPPVQGNKSSPRQEAAEKLMRIVLAFHEHNDTYKKLPATSIGKGLSWRVALLPFLGHKDLFAQFKLDEPWDSEDNVKLVAKIPPIYRFTSEEFKEEEGLTHVQIFTGPRTIWPNDKAAPAIPRSFEDGTVNTALVVESAKGVPWTKPEDLAVGQGPGTFPKLGFVRTDGFHLAMADGTIYFYPHKKADELTLRMLIDPMDGALLPPDWQGERSNLSTEPKNSKDAKGDEKKPADPMEKDGQQDRSGTLSFSPGGTLFSITAVDRNSFWQVADLTRKMP